MRILIKGAGDLASGIALRLHHCGFQVVMTECAVPTTVRRTVAFSPAVYRGSAQVEDVEGRLCRNLSEVFEAWRQGCVAVVVDPCAAICADLQPDAVVDAILAKRNLGTALTDAPVVIGVGPGFTAGQDCHCVVETRRGHDLGRCIYRGAAFPNTGVPGDIGGYTVERILRSENAGVFTGCVEIGAQVKAGEICGRVDGCPVCSRIDGVVRGLLQDGVMVTAGFKCGDVDPRCRRENCFTVSDKARAVSGGVLEALLHLSQGVR